MRSIAERNELVENNTGLVIFCVKKMNNGVYDEDLFQIGCFGLMRAAELYDETIGIKFSSYAVNGIEKSRRHMRRNGRERICDVNAEKRANFTQELEGYGSFRMKRLKRL